VVNIGQFPAKEIKVILMPNRFLERLEHFTYLLTYLLNYLLTYLITYLLT